MAMNALNIALKDLQIFIKDRGAVVQLFLLPLIFIVIFSGALASVGGEDQDARIPLPVVDLDGDQAAQTLLDNLDAAGGVRVERYEQEEAKSLLDENELARVLTVPADFSAGLAEGRPVTLRLVSHPVSDHRVVVPASALAGGSLLVVADTLARSLLAPRQLPVGALTAAIGVPLFLLLMSHRKDG